MPDLLSPLDKQMFILLPDTLVAWAVWLLLAGGLAVGLRAAWENDLRWNRRKVLIFAGLLVAVVLFTPFLGVRLSEVSGFTLPPPRIPIQPREPALMFFSALPWMIAAGLLGTFPAVALGALSGTILGLLETHSLFTPVEMAGLALLFSMAVRQRYRTRFFSLLRRPALAALAIAVLYAPLFLVTMAAATRGELVERLDYALTHLPGALLAIAVEMLIGGLLCEGLARWLPWQWGRQEALKPSPAESRLQLRFFYSIAPLFLLLLIGLVISDWFVAQGAAREMVRKRLESTARVNAESIPYFLETGQNLMLQFSADPRLYQLTQSQLPAELEQKMNSLPYFRQLAVLDSDLNLIATYPRNELARFEYSQEEKEGFDLALMGVQVQYYTARSSSQGTAGEVGFIAALVEPDGKVRRVLWGRADLANNPFTQPVIESLAGMSEQNGEGLLVDENGKILYHKDPEQIGKQYEGTLLTEVDYGDNLAPDGTRQLYYYQPVRGRAWSIILTVPAREIQQQALGMAAPLLVVILVIAVVVLVILYFGLRVVTASLVALLGEAALIAQGQFDHPLPPTSEVDESGQLRRAFEQMRLSLKARLEELNRLLMVSQGVASSLEIRGALRPILEAALSNQASAARVVLAEDIVLEPRQDSPSRFGYGQACDMYAYLDGQILGYTRQVGTLVLNNLTRGRGLNIPTQSPHPMSLIAVALRHENRFYGILWVGYDEPRTFADEEVRFLNTLAGQAALAAANARLYATAEVGRQRLEAILASTPEPVLVTDHQDRLMLTNPAAMQLPGMNRLTTAGQPVREVISQNELVGMLTGPVSEPISREIVFPNGKVYFATASVVLVDGQMVGRVVILRDITHFKELDALKSEFVATVSHDLRQPLTLMRGNTTMLSIVGELNEQQKTYVRKIQGGVETMMRLVNNLLDLGRIEAGVGLQLEMVSVNEVVERVVGSMQAQGAQKNIALSTELIPTQVMIEADAALLQQALTNLVDNAIKYTPNNNGQVLVCAVEKPASVLITVRDNGIGIAPLDQPRLFEKFYRGGQRESHLQRGSGLGLAIVKSIAERHGGRVWFESQLGKGSTFYLEVPRKQPASAQRATPAGD